MKKILLVLTLMIIMGLGIGKAEAVNYVSLLSTDGSCGWLEVDYSTTPVGGYYTYDYTLHLQDYGTYTLPDGKSYFSWFKSLKVMNPPGDNVTETSPSTPSNWNFVQASGNIYYEWDALNANHYLYNPYYGAIPTGAPIGSLSGFGIKSKVPPAMVTAFSWNGGGTAQGTTYGPVPEPTTLLLLGSGLLGLAAFGRKKRKV